MLSSLFFCCCIEWTNAKSINFNHHADFACHAKSVQIIQILKKVWKCVQNRLLLKFVQKTHQRSKGCPGLWRRRPRRWRWRWSGPRWQSQWRVHCRLLESEMSAKSFWSSANVWHHHDCLVASLSLNKQIIRQKLYTKSSPALWQGQTLERKVLKGGLSGLEHWHFVG